MTFDSKLLFSVACDLLPIYERQQDMYFYNLAGEIDDTTWLDAVNRYHKAVIERCRDIAKATGFGGAYLKNVFGVRGEMIIWTPEMFRQAANYESLNPNYWNDSRATKLHDFQFPGIVSDDKE